MPMLHIPANQKAIPDKQINKLPAKIFIVNLLLIVIVVKNNPLRAHTNYFTLAA